MIPRLTHSAPGPPGAAGRGPRARRGPRGAGASAVGASARGRCSPTARSFETVPGGGSLSLGRRSGRAGATRSIAGRGAADAPRRVTTGSTRTSSSREGRPTGAPLGRWLTEGRDDGRSGDGARASRGRDVGRGRRSSLGGGESAAGPSPPRDGPAGRRRAMRGAYWLLTSGRQNKRLTNARPAPRVRGSAFGAIWVAVGPAEVFVNNRDPCR